MVLISHRGNLNGKIPELENTLEYINKALKAGYDVEVDVWLNSYDQFCLGHEAPQPGYLSPYGDSLVEVEFLKRNGLWCHAKNISALNAMVKEDIHCFWHQKDDVTLTSR